VLGSLTVWPHPTERKKQEDMVIKEGYLDFLLAGSTCQGR